MAVNNTNPTTSVSENYSKYAEYFEQSGKNTVLSIETFFTLLMAEMSNQDPLEPTSNTEFISQLANFTALQNSSNTLYYNTVAYAASLAGKTVTVATTKPGANGKLEISTGVVTGVDISDSANIEITVNGKRYLLSNVMNVADTVNKGGYSSGSDGAYAVSLIGKQVTLVADTENGTVLDNGIVESIEIKDGEYRVVVNGYSYALSDVIKVNNADGGMTVKPGNNTDTETEETGKTETSIMEENEELKELFS
ncbi:MAG: flagellar hook capping protein [Oscillospiraceae bacterium]|nr:flagellar hook capping protein [Oscillospiraceae bacterium]